MLIILDKLNIIKPHKKSKNMLGSCTHLTIVSNAIDQIIVNTQFETFVAGIEFNKIIPY
jgi:hypothetical protein